MTTGATIRMLVPAAPEAERAREAERTSAPILVAGGPLPIHEDANVARMLREQAAAHPEDPALVGRDGRVRFTYAELTDRASSIAAALLDRGLRPGHRVALLVREPEQALVLAVAVLWAGGVLLIPPASRGWRAALRAASSARPTAVIADPLAWLVGAVLPGLAAAPIRVTGGRGVPPLLASVRELEKERVRAGAAVASGPVARRAAAPALVTWTTGTTGRPRAVVRSHAVLGAQHHAIARLRTPQPGDVDLVGLPNMALHDLGCGAAVVMPPPARDDPDGARLREAVVAAGVTTAVGFPTLFERLVLGAAPGALPRLRSVHVGGAPVSPGLLERLAVVAPNADVVVVYGATQVEPIAAAPAVDVREAAAEGIMGRGRLVGRPVDGIELRLASLDGGREPRSGRDRPAGRASRATPGPCGRILVRGPMVASGPGIADPGGWLDTGDIGTIDEQGRIWLLGRASAMAGGLAPAEVEEALAALEGVGAAVLLNVPGDRAMGAVVAVESATRTADADAVRMRVARLASSRGWELDRIAVMHRLPRDVRSGKIDYPRLRAQLAGR